MMGIGLHGGGVATARWLVKNGAMVTATDKRDKETLAPSLRALSKLKIKYSLGGHRCDDFRTHDLVVVNPGVPRDSEFLAIAAKAKKRIENDASLFFRYSDNPAIAITGTRGKTTTTLWVANLLKKKYPQVAPCGNTPDNAFLKEFDRIKGKRVPVVAEMSSWQLEYLPVSGVAPHVAIITNLYHDHLNRYDGMKDYANAKANIFTGQDDGDFLILNYDNEWTRYFLGKKPKALLFFTSKKVLPRTLNGLFVRSEFLFFRFDGMEQKLFSVKRFIAERGAHNLENLMHAVLAVKLFDSSVVVGERDVLRLSTPRMRQEVVYRKGRLSVVNDSCATSPDGAIAAIERFRKLGNVIIICGGTDKVLDFDELARVIKKQIKPEHLILLGGTATNKLQKEFHEQNMSRLSLDIEVRENLDSCVVEAFRLAKKLKRKTTILFSPGAASFEKFLHEFDRGEQFNKLVKKYTK